MTVSTNSIFEDTEIDLFPPPDPPSQQRHRSASGSSSGPPSSSGTTSNCPVVSQPSQGHPHGDLSNSELIDLSSSGVGDMFSGIDDTLIGDDGNTRRQKIPPTNAGGSVPQDSFRRLNMFHGAFPVSSSEKARLSSCRPVDWADAFCSDFHLSIDSDPKIWKTLCKEFDKVTDLPSLQRFLSCELNGRPFAFLGLDHDKKLRLIHNVLLAPDAGSIVNPDHSFVCLTQKDFDSPPVALVSDDLQALLVSTDYSGIPPALKIFSNCVSDLLADSDPSKSRPDEVLPDFRFNPSKFSELEIPEDDDIGEDAPGDEVRDTDPTSFNYMSLFPIHPSVAGELLILFSKNGYDSSACTPQEVAAFVFRILLKRWARSIGQSRFAQAKAVDLSHPVFSELLPLFRFLWIALKKPRNIDPLTFDIPSQFDAASKLFRRHLAKAFPDQNSPFRLNPRSARRELPPTPNQSPAVPPIGVPPSSFGGGISPEAIMMTERLSDRISETFFKHASRFSRDKEDEKKDIFKNAIHLKNGILFGQVNADSTELPSSPTELATEIFRQKSTHTLHSLIHARVFRKSQNACYILFSQCGVLQKYGLRWKGDDHPSGFSPFSFDPYNNSGPEAHLSLDSDIHQHIYECSLRQDNGLSTKDMRDIFTNEKLFCPLTCDEYLMQLRSYYLFAAAVWGSSSFVVGQIHKMVEHHIANRRIYRNSQNYDNKFLTQVLFSIDDAVQRYIEDILEPAECLEDITFDSLSYHTNQLCYKITARETVCRMLPRFFLSALNTESNKVTPNSSSSTSGGTSSSQNNDSRKRKADSSNNNDSNPTSKKRAKFDSPKEWCLPPRMKYSRVFTRSVLEQMPKMEINGEPKAFCNKLLALKVCKSGDDCHFCHADPREHGKGEEVNAFYKKVYAEAKKNNS